MKVIILAAGVSRRLSALTMNKPKCLLPFGDTTVLERQIELLTSAGIEKTDVFIVAGHKHETLTDIHPNLIINEHYQTTDNSYSLGIALEHVGCSDDVLVLDGDLIFDREVIEDIVRDRRSNVVLSKAITDTEESTGITVDEEQRVCEIGKHVKNSGYVYLSIFKIGAAAVPGFKAELLKEEYRESWYTIPLSTLLRQHPFYCKVVRGKWHEIDTVSDYAQAKQLFGVEDKAVLVIGASGFLGQKVMQYLARGHVVFGTTYTQAHHELTRLDITDADAVERVLGTIKPDTVICAAAIADPDACEADEEMADSVNYRGIENLVHACSKLDTKLIFISTDYVFDGKTKNLYTEEDETSPQSVYGRTKAAAEGLVKRVMDRYLIIRAPIMYGYNGNCDRETFATKVIRALQDGRDICVDNRQIRYPVLIDEVASAITRLSGETGIIHLSSEEGVTKFEWARIIARNWGFSDDKVHRGDDVDLDKRPEHVRLCTVRQRSYGIQLSSVDRGSEILKRQMNCVLQLIYRSSPEEYALGVNVGDFRIKLGKELARISGDTANLADMVIPVPESGLFSATGYADAVGIPIYHGIVRNNYVGRLFYESPRKRCDLTRSKLVPISEVVRGKRVVVVDEAIFTGSTLKIVCDMLRACEVGEIHIRIPSPPIVSQCNAYVQPERALLAESLGERGLEQYFGANSLSFLDYDVFCRLYSENAYVCDSCLDDSMHQPE